MDDIFKLSWVKKEAYIEFSLPKLGLVYRILKDEHRFKVMTRYQREPAWVLGYMGTMSEAKYKIYYHIIQFRLYLYGKWQPQSSEQRQKSFFEHYKADLYHLYPQELIDKIELIKYHGAYNLYSRRESI